MNKNIELPLDDVRDNIRGKRGEYESGAELMADMARAMFWASVESGQFDEYKEPKLDLLDIWGLLTDTCKLDSYIDYSRERLSLSNESIVTSCYVVFGQGDRFVSVYGSEPVGKYDGKYLIIEVRVARSGKIIATCL